MLTRAERRYRKYVVIVARMRTVTNIWHCDQEDFTPGRLAKWNLNCGDTMCHHMKYFKEKRKRRRALDLAVTENIESFSE